ncbi:hypothetical protein LKZ96_13800 [Serratia marcescens]|uniref:hypothetical protein n=1 Tax=Serratia marcescens TaxID=615 RepID=UPI001F1C9245|nr:hypothetical protein [Serratia marcescens]UKG72763.1 hypothetical protein LKZ96_13800 [Serratia marcescens]
MTTIKRFTPDYAMHAARFEPFAREAEHGEYVLFDAHQQVVCALEAERDALAVENAAMRGVIDAAVAVANNSAGIAGWHLNGEIADWDEILPELNIETPATDTALAAIQAQGVEKAASALDALSAQSASATTQASLRAAAVYLRAEVLPAIWEAK